MTELQQQSPPGRCQRRRSAAARLLPLAYRSGAWAALAVALGLSAARAAHAAWPPPPEATSASLHDANNWPNDPDYGYVAALDATQRQNGQWQLYSFIPEQSLQTRLIRSGERASGSSVDLAWRHTIGDPRVRIAVIDSGIRWAERDLLEKVHLNAGELQSHLPQHADGSPCGPLDPTEPAENLFDCNSDGQLTIDDYAETPWLQPEPVEVPCEAGPCFNPRGDANKNGVLDPADLLAQSSVEAGLTIADGVDDDANGYVDDVAGWDFLDDDNDPADGYDRTSASHGTQRTLDAAAATNNGVGRAGVCPLCTVVPLRVSDRQVTEAQVFAKAVAYAVDNGAAVVLAAVTSVDMSRFAQAALDYAWDHGVLVIASVGDHGSRYHNAPATANHTLPVTAVTMAGTNPESTTTTSFLAASPCANYGAQSLLAAPSSGSSREAAAHAAGTAALVQSAALSLGHGQLSPRLEPGELLQLLLMTADDVDLSESRQQDATAHWSQPGFDQRFGYGRLNANLAVQQLVEGRIPPVIDLVSPRWFEVLYADQRTAPVAIRGTISARRAQSYDYWVEWAPGVQPLDGAFNIVEQVQNVDAGKVSGGEGQPLAEFDIRSLDLSHERDVDSPLGENDFTVTVRVRAVAHYPGQLGDVAGELRRAYAVHEDPDLIEGFPLYLGASGEASPKLADVDGDGVRDVVVATADGQLHVLNATAERPTPVEGFPFSTARVTGLEQTTGRSAACESGPCVDYRRAPAYSAGSGIELEAASEALLATVAIADLTGNGRPEIVLATYAGTLYVVDSTGSTLPGWPQRLPEVPACPEETAARPQPPCRGPTARLGRGALASPVLEDISGDGRLEIVQAGLDGYLHVYRVDGSTLPGWPVRVHYPPTEDEDEVAPGRIVSTPAVADFDANGVVDLLVGSNERLGTRGAQGGVYLIDGRGQLASETPYLSNWPISVTSFSLLPLLAEGLPASPVAADFNADGLADAVLHGNGSDPLILPADPGLQAPPGSLPASALPEREDPETGQLARGLQPTRRFGPDSAAPRVDTVVPLFGQPAVGDLNQDSVPDVVTAGTYLDTAQSLSACSPPPERPAYLLGMWDGKTGAMLPGSPVPIEDLSLLSSAAIADISADGYPEVIVGSSGYYLHAVDACGREPEDWPKFTGQWIWATPAVGDIEGDGSLDVVVVTRAGWLYAWRTEASVDTTIEWESYHHDNRNTGNLQVPLEQGAAPGAVPPLPLDEEGRCLPTDELAEEPEQAFELAARGGCGCSCPGRRQTPGRALGLALAGLALLRLRRCGRPSPRNR